MQRWTERQPIRAELTITREARPLHPEAEVTLLRAAQEAFPEPGH